MIDQPEQRSAAPDGRPDAEQPAWRRDFPVDIPQDHYVARRDFTKFMGLTSLAFAVGQLWIAVQNWLDNRRPRPGRQALARLDDIPVGGALPFAYPEPDDHCLLIRPTNDTVLAYDQRCTHLSCAVVPDMAGDCLRCPCHHGLFDLTTGRPLAGPPRRPLPRITLEVCEGLIYACGVERRTV
jgi:Rieske Fe-S protein